MSGKVEKLRRASLGSACHDRRMKWPTTFCFSLMACATTAEAGGPLPTEVAAAGAYVAHEVNVCRALIDVCDGVSPAAPDKVESLACRRERQGAASCTFEHSGSKCRARFMRSNDAPDGWIVAFRNRVPIGADVDCE